MSTAAAFLAGVAFAVQFNNAAIEARLCPSHTAMLLRGSAASFGAVRPEDRR